MGKSTEPHLLELRCILFIPFEINRMHLSPFDNCSQTVSTPIEINSYQSCPLRDGTPWHSVSWKFSKLYWPNDLPGRLKAIKTTILTLWH
jgi:hypothetical protein